MKGSTKFEECAAEIFYPTLLLRKKFKKELEERKIQLYAWTVNSEKAMQNLWEMQIDGIITDKPELLIESFRGISP